MQNIDNLLKRKMKWQIDMDNYFDVFSTFILDGYIDDIQPYVDEELNEVRETSIEEYFVSKYYDERTENKKVVVIYDPTESLDKRFNICVPYETREEESEEDGESKEVRVYDNRLAQHFWDILQEEELDKMLIEHNASGPTLDMARLHYAITEADRMSDSELLSHFREFLDSIRMESSDVTGFIFIIKTTSRLLSSAGKGDGVSTLGVDELLIFRQLLSISQSFKDRKKDKLIVLANKTTDLPMWFSDETSNPYIKNLTVTKPTIENKEAYFDQLIEDGIFGEAFIEQYRNQINQNPDYEASIKKKFCAYTDEFSMRTLKYYSHFLENHPIENLDKLRYSVTSFKVGDMKNPWDDEERVQEILKIKEAVSKKIKGQDFALDTVQNILTRAAIGLDRLDNPTAPRVVLFLAGPTGTGKTEICKQLALTIFGSEDRIIRFDMSEYGQEHADQKLFGAPPGYVGYEEGGKLTNAIKKEPFSLILFDEIEKAHNKILDKFLQILGDGRLTDGKGETVSFTDSIIAITSNAGVTSPTPKTIQEEEEITKKMGGDTRPESEINMRAVIEMETNEVLEEEIYNRVKEYLRYNVKYYFNCQLNRPELYGRIEDSLVYYNYIGKDAVSLICNAKINSYNKACKEEFRLANVVCDSCVLPLIDRYCQEENVRSLGARGIGKAVNKLYNGSLSNFLADYVKGKKADGTVVSRQDLIGKVLRCSSNALEGTLISVNDLIWSVE